MQPSTEQDLTRNLPPELLLKIFCNLSVNDLSTVATVCRRWNEVVKCELLWRQQCHQFCDLENVAADRKQGRSWKDTFRLNYGVGALKKKWKLGHFSQPKSYLDLPCKIMCKMDAEEWGEILQFEMER